MTRAAAPPTLRTILAAHAVVLGAGYALGPPAWSSSGTLAVVRSLGLPIPVWGVLFVTAGVLLFAGAHRTGHALAAAAFAFWAGCLLATLPLGSLQGWGGPIHYAVLALPCHLLGLWRGQTTARAQHRTR